MKLFECVNKFNAINVLITIQSRAMIKYLFFIIVLY